MRKFFFSIIKFILKQMKLDSLRKKIVANYYRNIDSKNEKRRIERNHNLVEEEFEQFRKLESKTKKRFELTKKDITPYLDDKTSSTPFDTHYTYHPAWAARILNKTKPGLHIDISSSVSFCTMVSAFIPVKFYDYRITKLKLPGLECGQADLTSLPFENNSVLSLSCMHVLEHIGLGRYGDDMDYDGDLKAINELKRVLAINGNLLLVVPVGKPIIQFNGQRIYSYEQILEHFNDLKLIEYSLIPDNVADVGILKNASNEISSKQEYGCGCFWFKK
ncbi:MAG: DUF268 domain-containing protein [Bacteroidales bacterium]|nr:DUF268 domain-containing protein [Bacteroidales bacterium]